MAIKYKPGGKSRGFKNIGQGLRAGEQRLTEQQKRHTDALKLAQLQSDRNSKNFISGLQSKHRFEEGVVDQKNRLKDNLRVHQYEAFKKYAQTEVDYLEGVADQKKDYAEWISQYGPFAPKSVSAYINIAKGGLATVDKLTGRAKYNKSLLDGTIHDRLEATEIADLEIKKQMMLNDQNIKGPLLAKFYKGGSSNITYGYTILNDKNNNKNREHDKAKTFFKDLGVAYNDNNAIQMMAFYAHEEMERLGVSRNSEPGRKILNFYMALASDDIYVFEGEEAFQETQSELNKGVDAYFAEKAKVIEGESEQDKLKRITIAFNKLIRITEEGTFKGKNNEIIRPGLGEGRHGYNPATAYEAVLSHLSTNYNNKWSSTDEFKEDVGSYYTLPTPDGFITDGDGKYVLDDNGDKQVKYKESNEIWGIKHPLRLERGGDSHMDFRNKKANAKKAELINSENEVLITSFNERYEKAQEEFKGNAKGLANWLAGEVTQAHGYTTGNEVAKNHVYKISGLSANQYSSAHIFGSISALYHGGNVDDAQTLFASQSPQVQRLLAPEFDTFMNVEKSGFSFKGKATVSESLDAYVTNKVSAAETYVGTGSTSKVMNNSAYHIMVEMKNDIVNEYTGLLASKEYKDDHKGAMNAAIALVDKKFEEGAPDKKGEKGWETNKYRRTKGGYGINNVPGLNYEAYAASSDAPLVEKIRALRTSREDISKSDVGDVEVGKFTTDTITNIHKYEELQGDQKASEDYIIDHPRALADTHDTKDWDDRLTGPNPGYRGVDFEVHPNIIAFHEATQIPVYEILNRLMIRDKRKGRFIAGGEDGVSWKNDGKFVRKRNVQGVNQWCSAKAQGGDECYPMSEQARAYFNNKYGGSDFFFEKNEISHYYDDTGALKVSNLNGYIENGGLHNLPSGMTPTNAINSFGLMGVPFSTGVK